MVHFSHIGCCLTNACTRQSLLSRFVPDATGVQMRAMMFGDFRPPMTSLADFESHYWDLVNSDHGNYGWYQTQIAVRAYDVFQHHGVGLITPLKAELPWDTFREWTTAELISRLEEFEPGFKPWATSLEN